MAPRGKPLTPILGIPSPLQSPPPLPILSTVFCVIWGYTSGSRINFLARIRCILSAHLLRPRTGAHPLTFLCASIPCVKRSPRLPRVSSFPNLGILHLQSLFLTCWQWRLLSRIVRTLVGVHSWVERTDFRVREPDSNCSLIVMAR